MTREEAITLLNGCRSPLPLSPEIDETLTMAIKALGQEPCEDAISRQAVNTLVDELARAISDERCCMSRGRSTATIMQDILDLPSVNPQEPNIDMEREKVKILQKRAYLEGFHEAIKMLVKQEPTKAGHWIPYLKEGLTDMCSECGSRFDRPWNYCPHCGARMVEAKGEE